MVVVVLPQAVREYLAAIEALDAAAFVATFAADAVQEDQVGAPPNRDIASIRQFFEGIAVAFAAVELILDEVYGNGSGLAIKWTGQATAKTGRRATFAGIDVIDLNAAGKIQHLQAFWDPTTLLAAAQ